MSDAQMMAFSNMRLDSKGEIESCGFELNGVHMNLSGDSMDVFSSSLMVLKSGHALAKIVGKKGKISNGINQLKTEEIHGGWFRVPGKTAATPNAPVIDGENAGSILFATDLLPATEILSGIANGSEVQVAVSWKPGYHTIYFGTPALEDKHKQQFYSCIRDIVTAMGKTTEK